MRKLFIFLSVVLLIALCQSKERNTTRLNRPFISPPPFDCIFGFKKVNGTKKCKTMEEFFKHPRNETNCTKIQKLKCYNFKNETACVCVKKFKLPKIEIPYKCPMGLVRRCKRRANSNKTDCHCTRFIPPKKNISRISTLANQCPEGKRFFCSYDGCKCR